MEGNQEVITLVATCMALLRGALNLVLEVKSFIGLSNLHKQVVICTGRVLHVAAPFLIAVKCRITVCRSALHNQEV